MLPKEKKIRLDIVLYLNYMTKNGMITWNKSSSDSNYLYDSEYKGWKLKIKKKNENSIESSYHLSIEKRGSDLLPHISEDYISAVRDLVLMVEKQLGMRGKGVESELEDFRNMVADECDHRFD